MKMKNENNENGSNSVAVENEEMIGLNRDMVVHVAQIFCNPDPQVRYAEAYKILNAMFGEHEATRVMMYIEDASHSEAVIRSLDASDEELL